MTIPNLELIRNLVASQFSNDVDWLAGEIGALCIAHKWTRAECDDVLALMQNFREKIILGAMDTVEEVLKAHEVQK
jgi:hypothetical protein